MASAIVKNRRSAPMHFSIRSVLILSCRLYEAETQKSFDNFEIDFFCLMRLCC